MLVKETTFRGSGEYPLEKLVAEELNSSNYDGAIEQISDKIEKQAKFLGHLANVLADKDILTVEQFRLAFRGYDDESLEFVKQ